MATPSIMHDSAQQGTNTVAWAKRYSRPQRAVPKIESTRGAGGRIAICGSKTKAEHNDITRDWLADIAPEHPDEFNDDTSTSFSKNGSDTPSVYATEMSDHELFRVYHDVAR